MTRRRFQGALLGALTFVAGCTSGPGSEAGNGAERSADPTVTEAATDGSAEVFDIGLTAVESLDPVFASPASVDQTVVADLLFDTLTRIDDAGRVRPGIADFSATADLTVWRFDVRPDTTFADGSPVTAEDVAHSLGRARGLGPSSLVALQLENVASVDVRDEDTVDVTLASPSAVLPEVLAAPAFGIVDDAAGGGTPNASGPYAVDAIEGGVVALTRRDGRSERAGPERIDLQLFGTPEAAADALGDGRLDWAALPATVLPAASADLTVAADPFHATIALAVNPSVEPLTERVLRRGVALALHRQAIAAAVFGSGATGARGLVPAGTPGVPAACVDPCGPDVEEATRLVGEAIPDPGQRTLRLLLDGTATQEAIGGILTNQLAGVGIEVLTTAVEPATFDQLVAGSEQPLYLFSLLGVSRTPVSTLRSGFRSDSPDNLVGYRNDLVDVAIDSAEREPIASVRAARWRDVEAAILADAPVVPLVQLATTHALADGWEGLRVRVDGTLDLSALRPT